MTQYWEVEVTLRLRTKDGKLPSHDAISQAFQRCGMPHLAEFVQGKIVETPDATWTGMHKQMDALAKLLP